MTRASLAQPHPHTQKNKNLRQITSPAPPEISTQVAPHPKSNYREKLRTAAAKLAFHLELLPPPLSDIKLLPLFLFLFCLGIYAARLLNNSSAVSGYMEYLPAVVQQAS